MALVILAALFFSKAGAPSETEPAKARIVQAGVFVAGTLWLAGAWRFVFLWQAMLAEGWYAPWDMAPGRPPIGTWERALNDFFANPVGSILPGTLIIVISLILFVARLARARRKFWLPVLFSASNIVFVMLNMLLTIGLAHLINLWLPQPVAGFDAGYHRAWPVIALNICLAIGLVVAQATFTVKDLDKALSGEPRH